MSNSKKLYFIISLILISTKLFSADSISKAFDEATITGEFKSQYFQKNYLGNKVSMLTNGANLTYTTGFYKGIKLNATFQTASVDYESSGNSQEAYKSDQYVSGTTLSESYVQYTYNNSTVKLGRQYISTPLMNGSESRIFKESFEGVSFLNTDIPNTTILLAHIDKEQYRTDIASGGTTYKQVSRFREIQNGVDSIYINNTFDQLNIDVNYIQIKSDETGTSNTKALYASASYDLDILKIGIQTYQTDDGNTTNSKGSEYGIDLKSNIDKLSLSASYTLIDDKATVVHGVGNGADYIYTAPKVYGGVYLANTDAYKLSTGYSFTDDFSLDIMHTAWKTGDTTKKSENDFIASYNFTKRLSSTFIYADLNNIASETYRTRLYISYKF